jgi:hypothetical protein
MYEPLEPFGPISIFPHVPALTHSSPSPTCAPPTPTSRLTYPASTLAPQLTFCSRRAVTYHRSQTSIDSMSPCDESPARVTAVVMPSTHEPMPPTIASASFCCFGIHGWPTPRPSGHWHRRAALPGLLPGDHLGGVCASYSSCLCLVPCRKVGDLFCPLLCVLRVPLVRPIVLLLDISWSIHSS